MNQLNDHPMNQMFFAWWIDSVIIWRINSDNLETWMNQFGFYLTNRFCCHLANWWGSRLKNRLDFCLANQTDYHLINQIRYCLAFHPGYCQMSRLRKTLKPTAYQQDMFIIVLSDESTRTLPASSTWGKSDTNLLGHCLINCISSSLIHWLFLMNRLIRTSWAMVWQILSAIV